MMRRHVLTLICLLIELSLAEWSTEWTTSPDFFDQLHLNARSARFSEEHPESNVALVTTQDNTTYRMAHIAAFLPFSNNLYARAGVFNHAAGVLLAIYHFNHKETSPILHDKLSDCNLRLTAELLDTRMDEVISTSMALQQVQQMDRQYSRNPPPAAILGAYRSAVTSPVALVSGSYDILQMSAMSTSTAFQNTEQYPFFSRSCPSSEGEAQAVVDYFQFLGNRFHKQVEYVGVLFVTDHFGAALQRTFQDSAADVGIQTISIPFGYSKEEDIAEAVAKLKETEFRYFYVICFETHYTSIMTAASSLGITGDGFLWLFQGPDMDSLHDLAQYPKDSPVYKATAGVGFVQFDARIHENARFPTKDSIQETLGNPATNQEWIITSWRQAIQDPIFTDYVRSKIPRSLRTMRGYNAGAPLAADPSVDASFLYDAVTTMGIAMCQAQTNFFTAPDVAPSMKNIAFEGLTGNVVFDSVGTRDYRTVTFTVWNARPRDVGDARAVSDDEYGSGDSDEEAELGSFSFIPVHYYSNGAWKDLGENNTFIYADGTAIPPDNLAPVLAESESVETTSVVGVVVLLGFAVLSSLYCLLWTILNRKEPVVCASQMTFLVLIASGSLIASLSVVPLAIQESPVDSQRLKDFACMGVPWLFYVGVSIASSAIIVKLWRLRQVFANPELDRVFLTQLDFVVWCSCFVGFNVIFLTLWSVFSPWKWLPSESESTDLFGRSSSHFSCQIEGARISPYAVAIVAFHAFTLLVACWWSYRTSELETEYKETQYIGYTVMLLLETVVIVTPLVTLVDANRASSFFLMAGSVFLVCMVLLSLIFVPKMIALSKERRRATQNLLKGQSLRLIRSPNRMEPDEGETDRRRHREGNMNGVERNGDAFVVGSNEPHANESIEPSLEFPMGLKTTHHPKAELDVSNMSLKDRLAHFNSSRGHLSSTNKSWLLTTRPEPSSGMDPPTNSASAAGSLASSSDAKETPNRAGKNELEKEEDDD